MKWNTSTQTACDRIVSTTADNSPMKPPIVAPRVVQPFHSTDMNSTGKLAEAATAKASDTMKAIFCFSKTMPSTTATTPRMTVVIRDTCSSSRLLALPCLNTVAYRSCDTADAPASVRPATTARMVAKATAEIKPRNTFPPTALARWTAAILTPPSSLPLPSWKVGFVPTSTMAPKPMMKVRI
ncbi:hypothetical protein D3C85_1432560 [compost metagenome]